jgi:hypothetical protein
LAFAANPIAKNVFFEQGKRLSEPQCIATDKLMIADLIFDLPLMAAVFSAAQWIPNKSKNRDNWQSVYIMTV